VSRGAGAIGGHRKSLGWRVILGSYAPAGRWIQDAGAACAPAQDAFRKAARRISASMAALAAVLSWFVVRTPFSLSMSALCQHRKSALLFDHGVGAREQRWRERETKRLRRLEVER
jgi:hypothetical protein